MCKYVLSLCGPCWTKVCHSFLPIESWLLRWQSDPFASQWEFIFCQWIMKNKLVIIVVKSLRALESILARLKCKSQDIFWWRRLFALLGIVTQLLHCRLFTPTQRASYFCYREVTRAYKMQNRLFLMLNLFYLENIHIFTSNCTYVI